MTGDGVRARQPRTVLEQKLWHRRQTLEEFAEFAETFARQHNEPGTLSVRHLKRLIAGQGGNSKPIGPPRPATARLLERIFGATIDELLSPPATAASDDSEQELRDRLRTSTRIDSAVLRLLDEQLSATRVLDRQLGAVVAHDEVLAKTRQVTGFLHYSLTPAKRQRLAALLSELATLAGWQALDMGRTAESWQHYEHSKAAARESENPAYLAHSEAEQAFVLLDLGRTTAAVDVLAVVRKRAASTADALLMAWLAAAHGEALAADRQRQASLSAFDQAAALMPGERRDVDGPYVVLDPIHLARWRGHALARIGEAEAVAVLSAALDQLDPTFARAESALRVDLATAYYAKHELDGARTHLRSATKLAQGIGSVRQRRRIQSLVAVI